jgi:5-amino-6-(5-phospho-D-ribitylamino)uracil phosphatase
LLAPDGTVSKRTTSAVRLALNAGLIVCFATGRNFTESSDILDTLQHYDTAVFVGGAMVIDTRHRITLHRTAMQPTMAAELCQLIEAEGHAALALQDTGQAGVDYLITAAIDLNEAMRRWLSVTAAKVHRVDDLSHYAHRYTIRVGLVAKTEEVGRMRGKLRDHFGESIVCQSLYVPGYGVEVLEAFDPAVNKWQGVLHAARRRGIAPAEIIAIGDDVNDIPMLANAGLGVAMGNAKAEVKAVAQRVIGTNGEDGLARFLEELVEQQHSPAASAPAQAASRPPGLTKHG